MIKQLLTLALIPSLLHGGGGCSKMTAAPKNAERKNARALSPKRANTLAALAAAAQKSQEEKANNYEASKAVTSTDASISATQSLVRVLDAPNEASQADQVVAITISPKPKPIPPAKKKKGLGKLREPHFGDPHIPAYLLHHAQSPSTNDNSLINALGNKPKINTQQSVDMTYNDQLGN